MNKIIDENAEKNDEKGSHLQWLKGAIYAF